jgi:hypothetical protein
MPGAWPQQDTADNGTYKNLQLQATSWLACALGRPTHGLLVHGQRQATELQIKLSNSMRHVYFIYLLLHLPSLEAGVTYMYMVCRDAGIILLLASA